MLTSLGLIPVPLAFERTRARTRPVVRDHHHSVVGLLELSTERASRSPTQSRRSPKEVRQAPFRTLGTPSSGRASSSSARSVRRSCQGGRAQQRNRVSDTEITTNARYTIRYLEGGRRSSKLQDTCNTVHPRVIAMPACFHADSGDSPCVH